LTVLYFGAIGSFLWSESDKKIVAKMNYIENKITSNNGEIYYVNYYPKKFKKIEQTKILTMMYNTEGGEFKIVVYDIIKQHSNIIFESVPLLDYDCCEELKYFEEIDGEIYINSVKPYTDQEEIYKMKLVKENNEYKLEEIK